MASGMVHGACLPLLSKMAAKVVDESELERKINSARVNRQKRTEKSERKKLREDCSRTNEKEDEANASNVQGQEKYNVLRMLLVLPLSSIS